MLFWCSTEKLLAGENVSKENAEDEEEDYMHCISSREAKVYTSHKVAFKSEVR